MADYTRLSKNSLNRLLRAYNLDPAEQITPLEGGQANSSYKITTQRGCFTLSICDEKNNLEIERLIRILDWLENCDFPTTRVATAKNGQRSISYDKKPVYIKTFISGEVVKELSAQMCFQVGSTMSRLHCLALPPQLKTELAGDNAFVPAVFDNFLHQGIAHPYSDWLKEKRDYLCSSLDSTMAKSLIHGDLFWDNLIFSEGQLEALLDFEEACFFYRLFDLAMGIIGCCSRDGNFLRTQARGFIAGYQSICPLTAGEKEQLKVFIEYAGMASSLWRFQQYNLVNPDPAKMNSYRELSDLVDQIHRMSSADFSKEFIETSKSFNP